MGGPTSNKTRSRLWAAPSRPSSSPSSWAAGRAEGVGARGLATRAGGRAGGGGGGDGGRPGQCASPALRGKSPREAAARALALPARRATWHPAAAAAAAPPARGPASRQHAAARAARLFPAARRRLRVQRGSCPASTDSERRRAARSPLTAAAERRQEADRPLPKCGQASRDHGGRRGPREGGPGQGANKKVPTPSPGCCK